MKVCVCETFFIKGSDGETRIITDVEVSGIYDLGVMQTILWDVAQGEDFQWTLKGLQNR